MLSTGQERGWEQVTLTGYMLLHNFKLQCSPCLDLCERSFSVLGSQRPQPDA